MLGFLRRLWSRDQRLLFSYHDGDRERWCDPIATAAAIEDACPDWGELSDLIREDPADLPAGGVRDGRKEEQKAARRKLLDATRAAFGLEPFTDAGGGKRGLPEAETVALLHRFLAWLFAAAEDARPFATSPQPGAGCRPGSPTAPSVGSGSTAGPSPEGTPTPSPPP